MSNLDFIKYLKEKLPYYCENLTITLGDYDIDLKMVVVEFFISKKGCQSYAIVKEISNDKLEKIHYEIIYQEIIHDLICNYLVNSYFFERMVDLIFESIKKYNINLVDFICKNCSNVEIEINYGCKRNVITIQKCDKANYLLGINMGKNPQVYSWNEVANEIETYFKNLNQKGETL